MNRRVEIGLTVGAAAVIALLLAGLGGAGEWATKAGLWGFAGLTVMGAISLVRGGRTDDDDHHPVGDRADAREPDGLGRGGRGDRDRMRGGTGRLGDERAWRAWLDEMEERDR